MKKNRSFHKAIRSYGGITATAKALGYTRQYVSGIYNGRYKPGRQFVQRFCAVFVGVKPESFK